MSSPSVWSSGRYEAVAMQIARIAAEVVDAVDRRTPLRGAALVDLACGTGNAALAAAARGAQVTAVDITPDLIAIGVGKVGGDSVTWLAADASDTGLPGGSYDAVISNMGLIFVEPVRQVAELGRLLTSGGTVGFSAWSHSNANPFFTPIVDVLGPPPASDYSPAEWGDRATINSRLAAGFDDIRLESGVLTWQFESLEAAVTFVTRESPTHVDVFRRVEGPPHDRLVTAFEKAFAAHLDAEGAVCFDAPYVVATARRR
jgi:SAM-dependent methyltransferase